MRHGCAVHASAASPRGRRLQISYRGKRQDRQCVGKFHSSILHRNRTTGEKIMRVLQRKRFGKFDCRVRPTLSNWRKTNARREARGDYNNPLVRQLSGEADAAFSKCSARRQRQIFSSLKKLEVLAPKLQDALR